MTWSAEMFGLILLVLSHIVVITIVIQSLRERVKELEKKAEKASDYSAILIKVESKLDLLYDMYLQQHAKGTD